MAAENPLVPVLPRTIPFFVGAARTCCSQGDLSRLFVMLYVMSNCVVWQSRTWPSQAFFITAYFRTITYHTTNALISKWRRTLPFRISRLQAGVVRVPGTIGCRHRRVCLWLTFL